MTSFKSLFLSGLAAAMVAFAAPALADQPNIVVMAEDADEETVPRFNRIFNRVIIALSEEMNTRGFNVYDETAVGMGITEPGRIRRIDTEIIDVARSIQRPPIDIVVVFQIYASARKSLYSDVTRPEIRIPGRMINVRTGQLIGAFEVGGSEFPPLPRECDRECLLEQVGNQAQVIARDLGLALSDKLIGFMGAGTPPEPTTEEATRDASGAIADGDVTEEAPVTKTKGCNGLPNAYVLKMEGFSRTEISSVEEYITAFSCYGAHRPIRSSGTQTEFWYEAQTDSARLNRNLRLMIEHMGLTGMVELSGNEFRVRKIGTR